jgi:hypothetical protein
MIKRYIGAAAIAFGALAAASTAHAGCTSTSDAGLVNKSLSKRCDATTRRCALDPPLVHRVADRPRAHDTLVGDAVALGLRSQQSVRRQGRHRRRA